MPSIRRPLVAVAAVALLAGAATACGPSGGDDAKATPTRTGATKDHASVPKLPSSLPTSLTGLKKWEQVYKDGGWKNWDKSSWLRKAKDFVNPVIDGLWSDDRMKHADHDDKQVPADVPGDRGKTDPVPTPEPARRISAPYHDNEPAEGKLFFDSPQGSMVCSATVVEDPAHPGKSDMVWTAGHCVHAGKSGGWYRNIAFVPDYNDGAASAQSLKNADVSKLAPYGVWWADWASTSDQWMRTGSQTGGGGSPYDFAVLHVSPAKGFAGRSLQETVGAAVPVWFDAPSATKISTVGALGYPAEQPYDGQAMYSCQGRPGRLSLLSSAPAEYRIGCTMTGGSSGGGWFATMPDGKSALVSNTSIGPVTATWLAGPRLGSVAKALYDGVSKKFA